MDEPTIRNPGYERLTNQQLEEIDRLCDRFDQELVRGDSPHIETFLAEVPQAAREVLLAELLAMEVEHCTKTGDELRPGDYHRRFPEHAHVIAGVFTRDATTYNPGGSTISLSTNATPLLENFRLIEELGHGGMGVVWLAEQDRPVKRRVALKLIKSELNSKDVIARFDAEKQALAMMDHPNIARVLDAGMTDDGRPYFVMELVEGIPVTQFCDEHKLSIDERLKLFVSICRAVQHAHQKGIIHRDLKPSNVLVSLIDGEAVPKVIDFGLAKAVEQNLMLTDMTMQTEFGKIVGTVQYMSPEQAELRGPEAEDIDTRTDVYSLGVMLYELLTGSTPVEKETLGRNALLKVLEIIREQDPPRPSNRLSSASHEVNSAVSGLRRLHPARLQQVLRGELDWVVMKALEKDRVRRYQTANDLAQDLSNYLTGETVTARPPSTWYQLQKFANRNRGLVAALLAVGVALIAGIAGTTFGLIRANEKTQLAEEEKNKAQRNEKRAVNAEDRAEIAANHARDSEASAKLQLAIARWDAGRARDARDLLREIPSEYHNTFEWNVYSRKFQGSDFTCYGHLSEVRAVAFSPDGTRVVTASGDSTIRFWDAVTGEQLNALTGHQGAVNKVVFSIDGTRVASAGNDRTIRIWEVSSGQSIALLEGHEDAIVGLEYIPNGNQLVSASLDATVRLWNLETEQPTSILNHGETVADVAVSADSKRVISCSDSTILLWDVATGREIARQDRRVRPALGPYSSPYLATRSVSFSPDGKYIASTSFDKVLLWDSELSQTIWTGTCEGGWNYDLSFSPDGTRLASAGDKDRQIRVWDVSSGAEIMAFVGHGDTVRCLAFSPDGGRIASVGSDKTLRLWDARAGRRQIVIPAHDGAVSGIAFNNDGTRLASVGSDGALKLWDSASGVMIGSRHGFENDMSPGTACVAFSPNGSYVAYGGDDNAVKLLDVQTGAEVCSFAGHENRICGVAFDPDGKRLVSGSWDQTVRLWDIDSGKEIKVFNEHAERVNSAVFHPDGTRFVSACDDLKIRFWDALSGREVMSLGGHQFNVAGIAFDLKGDRIVSASSDHTIRIWNTKSGTEIFRLKGHTAGVKAAIFSPDGKRIVSTGFDSAMKLWDADSGRELTDLDVDPATFRGVAFNPDGTQLAVGTDNGIIKIFDASIDHEVTALTGHSDTVVHFSFSDDGRRIYSESAKEKLVWDLETKQKIANAVWDPPKKRRYVSTDGRWLINGDRNYLVLVDLAQKNAPREKSYRAAKARFDRAWHDQQAKAADVAENEFAATFHLRLMAKHDSDSGALKDGFQSLLPDIQSKPTEEEGMPDPDNSLAGQPSSTQAPGVAQSNPGFESPRIRKGAFEFQQRVPGWETTSEQFEIWSSGFLGVDAFDGDQFVELNATEEGTLYQDRADIAQDVIIEFSFAHRGRNGDDTLKLTITDLGADKALGGGDDQELFAKEYTTGKDAWSAYNSASEPAIKATGNTVRFAFTAVRATGGKGPDNTEGNFLDSAEFGPGVVTAKRKSN